MTHRRGGWQLRCASLLALAACAPTLGACGGSSSTHTVTTTAGALTGSPSTATTKQTRDTVTQGTTVHRPLHGTGGSEFNDDNPGYADAPNPSAGSHDPCSLVSQSEAGTILRLPVHPPEEAPLGPTCIYRTGHSHGFVTLAVESVDFAAIKPRIRHRHRIRVDGRTAYCGYFGQDTVFVPLADGRTLDITASCTVGVQFAVRALPRLDS